MQLVLCQYIYFSEATSAALHPANLLLQWLAAMQYVSMLDFAFFIPEAMCAHSSASGGLSPVSMPVMYACHAWLP